MTSDITYLRRERRPIQMHALEETKQLISPCLNCKKKESIRTKFFARCNHHVMCLKCCEIHIKKCLDKELMPICPIQTCNARIVDEETSENSILNSLDKTIRVLYDEKINKIINNTKNLRKCTKQQKQKPCEGSIIKHRCTKCNTIFCENCGKDHTGKCPLSSLSERSKPDKLQLSFNGNPKTQSSHRNTRSLKRKKFSCYEPCCIF